MKKMGVKLFAAGLLIAAGCILTGGGSTKIDLNDYVVVDKDSYDGYGSVSFNDALLTTDVYRIMAKGKEKDSVSLMTVQNLLKTAYTHTEEFQDNAVNGYLSNGDTFKEIFTIDNSALKPYHITLKGEEKKYKVSGLKEVETFDVFESLDVRFSGTDGYGNVYWNAEKMKELLFTPDKDYALSNGDEVTFTAYDPTNQGSFSKYAERYGRIPESATKTYIVEGLTPIPTFDAFERLSVSFEGTDGFGRLRASTTDDTRLVFTFDKIEGLSNGDQVTATVMDAENRDSFYAYGQVFGSAPAENTKTYTVTGLTEIQEFDPFEGVQVELDATSPNGTVKITHPTGDPYGLRYSCSDTGVSSGDEVTVKVYYGYYNELDESFVSQYGKKPTQTEKKFKV